MKKAFCIMLLIVFSHHGIAANQQCEELGKFISLTYDAVKSNDFTNYNKVLPYKNNPNNLNFLATHVKTSLSFGFSKELTVEAGKHSCNAVTQIQYGRLITCNYPGDFELSWCVESYDTKSAITNPTLSCKEQDDIVESMYQRLTSSDEAEHILAGVSAMLRGSEVQSILQRVKEGIKGGAQEEVIRATQQYLCHHPEAQVYFGSMYICNGRSGAEETENCVDSILSIE